MRAVRTQSVGDDHLHTAGVAAKGGRAGRRPRGPPRRPASPRERQRPLYYYPELKKRKVGGGLRYSSESNRYSVLVRACETCASLQPKYVRWLGHGVYCFCGGEPRALAGFAVGFTRRRCDTLRLINTRFGRVNGVSKMRSGQMNRGAFRA